MASLPADYGIRRAEARDLEALVSLARQSYEDQVRWDGDFQLRPGWEEYYRRLINAAWDGQVLRVWVARHSEAVVGFFSMMISADPTWADDTRANGLDLFVAPRHRRQGCARALVEAALNDCREHKIRITVLNVFTGNEAALGFWRALGFRPFMTRFKRVEDSRDS